MPSKRDRSRSLFIVLVALAAGAAIALVRRVDVVIVRGGSMAPALRPGDRLLVVRTDRAPTIGEVVLATDPRERGRELIKRVTAVQSGAVTLRGDAPHASTDSRAFGSVPAAAIRWRALLRYWPLDRAGAIPPLPPRPILDPIDEGGEAACAFPEALIAG